MQEITGGCFCGKVRYSATTSPVYSIICYCEDCRRINGAQSVAWITVAADSFHITQGEPTSYKSSEHVVRTFCSECGTSLTYRSDKRAGEVDITTGSLDEPGRFPPTQTSFKKHKLAWDCVPHEDTMGIACE